ncbi:MAG: aminotransferase class I/II-fold pyridoxal phosphate-dependent enzyme [Bacteroidia bacterium]|jgi:threonine aldolase|nr:aminotransferase class I/II-fold pyridoxal phosphate-dependent enzyme [Bacteroidia bacterium]
MNTIIDLRSDTVTKPTPEMLTAMMEAKVGDDVYGEDETVLALEHNLANMFDMEAGLFCPSGTMTNQIAIQIQTQPGDEVICADNAHIFKYEGGGMASNSGVQARLIPSVYGKIKTQDIDSAVNAVDVHFPRTSLVCLENTSNRGGGSFYTKEELLEIYQLCNKHNLPLHLDGARVFNALAVADYDATFLGNKFKTISVCLSKSLGAPVGSVLLGSNELIQQAKRVRKRMGGGMRQAGYIAAAGLYAIQHHVQLLPTDHQHAAFIAQMLQQQSFVEGMLPVKTNIIIFKLTNADVADKFQQFLKTNHILANKVSATELRFVFHLNITSDHVSELAECIKRFN